MNKKIKVADNLNTPIEVLIKLSEDENGGVRWAVAGNPNTPPEVLREMLNDENMFVRQEVENRIKREEKNNGQKN